MNNLKNSKLLKMIVCGVPLAFLLLVGAAMAASPFFGGSPVPELEKAFTLQMETITKAKEALCNTEIALAKAKLLDHYSEAQKQDSDSLERLSKKAAGENLVCNGF